MNKNKVLWATVILVALGLGFVVGQQVQAGSFEPGSYEDPLVSESYVKEQVDPQVQALEAKVTELETLADSLEKKVQTLEARLAEK